ncbi:MAG: hypothetical protein K0B07_01355 [DPANN group archaeon]|nr:hypothetical protein [DPANN group archaeon]
MLSDDIIIPNKERLHVLKDKIAKAGPDTLHVVTDFNRTLTKAYIDGKKTPSLISVLRNENYLSVEYAEKANELFDKYHPMEIDPLISEEDKRVAMNQWWTEHFNLLIKSQVLRRKM